MKIGRGGGGGGILKDSHQYQLQAWFSLRYLVFIILVFKLVQNEISNLSSSIS